MVGVISDYTLKLNSRSPTSAAIAYDPRPLQEESLIASLCPENVLSLLYPQSQYNPFIQEPHTKAGQWPLLFHSFITSIYIAPLQVGLLRGAPNPNTTK